MLLFALFAAVPPASAASQSGVATESNAVTYRIFLRDGGTIAAYGEFARVADRVVISIPIGGTDSSPLLHLLTIAEADVDWERTNAYVQAARAQFDGGEWSKMDARDRGKLLNDLADLIEQEIDELAALETLDNGKPIRDSRNADIPLVVDCLRYYAGWADKIQGATIPVRGEYFTYTRREPVGVVGQIIPWNFPALMVAWKWGPALAAGCTIVMKPAEQTPLT